VSNSDSTVVYDGIQGELDSLTDNFKRWKIKVNSSKNQVIYLTSAGFSSFGIALNGQKIPWTPEVKYLGVTLDKRLTFSSFTA
jgi:hypothetical protein